MKTIKIPNLLFALSFLVIISCSKSEDNVPLTVPTAQINVDKLVRQASLRNQTIPFSVLNENGDEVTAITTFYVDGQAISGNTFSSPTIGEFEVYGKYTENGVEITTNTKSFSVIIPKRKIVVEDYTGTWCGFCPKVADAIEATHAITNDIAVVAIHQTASSLPDPMHFESFDTLKDAFGVNGLPAARINRTNVWDDPYLADDIVAMAGVDTNMAISMVSEVNENTLVVKVNVVYENGSENGDKLVLYLLESGVVHAQTNYYNQDNTSPYFGLGNPIPNFVHNDALRLSLTQALGNNISATPALEEYSDTLTATLSTDFNVDNLSLVAMVVRADNSAKNAQVAQLNEDKAYE